MKNRGSLILHTLLTKKASTTHRPKNQESEHVFRVCGVLIRLE